MRFLLDENVHAKSTEVLRLQGHDVLHVIDTPLRGRTDTDLIAFCNQENRILVSRDLDVAKHAVSLRTGLILVRVPKEFVSRNVPGLLSDFVATAEEADVLSNLTLVSPGQIRRRALSNLPR